MFHKCLNNGDLSIFSIFNHHKHRNLPITRDAKNKIKNTKILPKFFRRKKEVKSKFELLHTLSK